MIKVKRVYETAAASDGRRILVDRIWPRGLRKEQAQIDVWLKEVAPSTELRKWFNHEVENWPEFQRRYYAELRKPGCCEALDRLRISANMGDITLLFAAKDMEHNNAVVLKEFLEVT